MSTAKKLKSLLSKKSAKESKTIPSSDFVSTGSTCLNLAISDRPRCGFAKGKYYLLVGDSSSGKTFLTLTCVAEAAINKHFEEYDFVYDDVEGGALMNLDKFFGPAVVERLQSPAMDGDMPVHSSTVEEFFYHVDDRIKSGRPFIYILDSSDALTSDQEEAKFEEQKKAHRKGKETTGVMTDGKAKLYSSKLRKIIKGLRKTGSILIIICQTRDSMGGGFSEKTRAGGRALKFYAATEIWSSVKTKHKREVRGKKRTIGIQCLLQIKKNRHSGKEGTTVEVPIYWSTGIDDIGACVDYLIEEKHLKKSQGIINAKKDFGFSGTREDLIKHIEEEDLYRELQGVCGQVWKEVLSECVVDRRSRFHKHSEEKDE